MDDRQPDTLTDAAIDREIRAALAVDPSPEFLARVRTRIADEPVAPSFRWSWVFAGAAATVIVVAVVASVSRRDLLTTDLSAVVRRKPANFGETSPKLGEGGKVGTTDVGTPGATRPADEKIGITDIPAADLSAVVRKDPANFGETSPKLGEGGKVGTTDAGTTGSPVVATFRSDGTKESPVPQVLISSDDARAFRQFVVRLSERNFELSFDEAFDVVETPVVTALTIQLITIEPLNASVTDEGAFQ